MKDELLLAMAVAVGIFSFFVLLDCLSLPTVERSFASGECINNCQYVNDRHVNVWVK